MSSREIIEGDYLLGSINPGDRIELAPGVEAVLIKEENQLCPSQYSSSIVCVC